ncbi:MAG: ester cyclase [Anaerolineales bacterium]|nr:ester cyclase [Anaerolineales bacterium]
MSPIANAAVVRRFFEAYNRNQPEVYAELCSPDYICHMGATATAAGLAANLESEAYFRAAFSDAHWEIADLMAVDDKVVVRRNWRLTHTGPFQSLPPSGRVLTGTAIDIHQLRDGRLIETWTESDNLSFMQQLGLLPAPAREPGL